MILQYFKKKENKEQIIATEQYKKILPNGKNLGIKIKVMLKIKIFQIK